MEDLYFNKVLIEKGEGKNMIGVVKNHTEPYQIDTDKGTFYCGREEFMLLGNTTSWPVIDLSWIK